MSQSRCRHSLGTWLLTLMAFTTATSFAAESLQVVQEKVSRNSVPGEGVIFQPAEKNLHCVAYGGDYVWCGFSTSPSLVVKVDPNSMARERIAFKEERGLHDLSFDGTNVWAVGRPVLLPWSRRFREFAYG